VQAGPRESPATATAMIARTAFVASAVPLAAPHAPAGASPAACPRAPPVRIGYEVRGTGPVHVMFVPGMCISRRMWDAQIREFGKHPERYSLCLLDNRGAGESDIPPGGLLDARNSNYSLDTLARDAWTVADRVFGTSSKVHFIGWSMGSMVAQRYVQLYCTACLQAVWWRASVLTSLPPLPPPFARLSPTTQHCTTPAGPRRLAGPALR
jgi:pimeloyl-ACP methyl ester carboxylesterase